jgi:hypothetical protein
MSALDRDLKQALCNNLLLKGLRLQSRKVCLRQHVTLLEHAFVGSESADVFNFLFVMARNFL